MIKYLSEGDDFEKVIEKDKWIVDFYAEWCGPCKMLGPILEELDYNILKVNVDLFPDLAKENGVMSIPSLYYFNNKEFKERQIGLQSKEDIVDTYKKI